MGGTPLGAFLNILLCTFFWVAGVEYFHVLFLPVVSMRQYLTVLLLFTWFLLQRCLFLDFMSVVLLLEFIVYFMVFILQFRFNLQLLVFILLPEFLGQQFWEGWVWEVVVLFFFLKGVVGEFFS